MIKQAKQEGEKMNLKQKMGGVHLIKNKKSTEKKKLDN